MLYEAGGAWSVTKEIKMKRSKYETGLIARRVSKSKYVFETGLVPKRKSKKPKNQWFTVEMRVVTHKAQMVRAPDVAEAERRAHEVVFRRLARQGHEDIDIETTSWYEKGDE